MTITIRPNEYLQWFLQFYNQYPAYINYFLIGLVIAPIVLLVASKIREHKVKWYEQLAASFLLVATWPLLVFFGVVLLAMVCSFSFMRLFKENVS